MIGEKQKDQQGTFRMVNGKKIYQIEEKRLRDVRQNRVINLYRESGLTYDEWSKKVDREHLCDADENNQCLTCGKVVE